jgi:hypothetical protein
MAAMMLGTKRASKYMKKVQPIELHVLSPGDLRRNLTETALPVQYQSSLARLVSVLIT